MIHKVIRKIQNEQAQTFNYFNSTYKHSNAQTVSVRVAVTVNSINKCRR